MLVGIIRDDRPIAPSRDDAVEAHDELLFITTPDNEDVLEQMLSPGARPPRSDDYALARGRTSVVIREE